MRAKSQKQIEELDRLSLLLKAKYKTNGMARSEALEKNLCSKCGEGATDFKDETSSNEYQLSAWCQRCQDEYFEV